MNDFGTSVGLDAVRLERLLPASIDRAWLYLTAAKKRALWLAGGEFEWCVGGRAELDFDDATLAGGAGPRENARTRRARSPARSRAASRRTCSA